MKIGIMGGTFNPIHYGHLIIANQAIERFQLEKVIFVPSATPPHKQSREIIEPCHRFIMTIMATVTHSKMEVSDLEIRRGGKSYSIETVEELKNSFPSETDFFFIVGCDAFWEIATWKEAARLFRSCHFIISNRFAGVVKAEKVLEMLSQTVIPYFPDLTFKDGGIDPSFDCLKIIPSNSSYAIFLTQIPAIDISSTDIRSYIASGKSIKYLVPEPVEKYIIKFHLYQ
jgi:nicotinate-nucleotide adenylyltransferase